MNKIERTAYELSSRKNTPSLSIIRGIPGAGKSTYTKKLIEGDRAKWVIASADNYFIQDGQYVFDPSKLGEAHAHCLSTVKNALLKGESVILDNTNTMFWEAEKYIRFALENKFNIEIITIHGNYTDEQLELLAKRNVHGVPLHAIKVMNLRFQSHDEFVKQCTNLLTKQGEN